MNVNQQVYSPKQFALMNNNYDIAIDEENYQDLTEQSSQIN